VVYGVFNLAVYNSRGTQACRKDTKDQLINYLGRFLIDFVSILSLDGTFIKIGEIHEMMTAYDVSLPQHYGATTAGLDWTRNPYIALHFALKNNTQNTPCSVYIYESVQPNKLSPIQLVEGHKDCQNIRIMRQEGMLTRFNDRAACMYYLENGIWPSIETFIGHPQAEFAIHKIDIIPSQRDDFLYMLFELGITVDYLMAKDVEKSLHLVTNSV